MHAVKTFLLQWHYIWWIPIVFVHFGIYHYASKMNNEFGGKWIWITLFLGMSVQWWTIVSLVSRNLLFDGLLYGIVLTGNYVIVMAWLGAGAGYRWWQWLGVVVVVIGFALMKLEFKDGTASTISVGVNEEKTEKTPPVMAKDP